MDYVTADDVQPQQNGRMGQLDEGCAVKWYQSKLLPRAWIRLMTKAAGPIGGTRKAKLHLGRTGSKAVVL